MSELDDRPSPSVRPNSPLSGTDSTAASTRLRPNRSIENILDWAITTIKPSHSKIGLNSADPGVLVTASEFVPVQDIPRPRTRSRRPQLTVETHVQGHKSPQSLTSPTYRPLHVDAHTHRSTQNALQQMRLHKRLERRHRKLLMQPNIRGLEGGHETMMLSNAKRTSSPSPQVPNSIQLYEERSASWVEHFYDIGYVAAINVLAHTVRNREVVIGEGPSSLVVMIRPLSERLIMFFGYFAALWMTWIHSAMFNTRFDTDDVVTRLLTLGQLLGVCGLSIAIREPVSFGDTFLFRNCYIFITMLVMIKYFIVFMSVGKARKFALLQGLTLFVVMAIFSISYLLEPPHMFIPFLLSFLFEGYAITILSKPYTAALPIHASHLPERHGLFSNVILGEAVLAVLDVGSGASGVPIGFVAIAMMSIFGIWYTYYDDFSGQVVEYSSYSSEAWILCHLILHGALILFADSQAEFVGSIGHHHQQDAFRWVLAGSFSCVLISIGLIQSLSRCAIDRDDVIKVRAKIISGLLSFPLLIAVSTYWPSWVSLVFVFFVSMIQVLLDVYLQHRRSVKPLTATDRPHSPQTGPTLIRQRSHENVLGDDIQPTVPVIESKHQILNDTFHDEQIDDSIHIDTVDIDVDERTRSKSHGGPRRPSRRPSISSRKNRTNLIRPEPRSRSPPKDVEMGEIVDINTQILHPEN